MRIQLLLCPMLTRFPTQAHGIFAANGVRNVAWNWITMSYSFRGVPARIASVKALYPGDAYVDWISTDVYNWISPCPGDFVKVDLQNMHMRTFVYIVKHTTQVQSRTRGKNKILP